MTPHDQQRFAKMICDFVERRGIAPPLYLIAIGSNGAVVVSRHTESGNEQVCASTGAGIVSPVLLTVVGMDGRGTSAKIEIEAKRETVQ